jgi:hypothetical protein
MKFVYTPNQLDRAGFNAAHSAGCLSSEEYEDAMSAYACEIELTEEYLIQLGVFMYEKIQSGQKL